MDGVAKKRSWRDRQAKEVVRSEHTRVEVRQDFPDEVRAIVEEMASRIAGLTLELIDHKSRISSLESALRDIAIKAKEQAERLAKASEAA